MVADVDAPNGGFIKRCQVADQHFFYSIRVATLEAIVLTFSCFIVLCANAAPTFRSTVRSSLKGINYGTS
jgi:hypothetical protein